MTPEELFVYQTTLRSIENLSCARLGTHAFRNAHGDYCATGSWSGEVGSTLEPNNPQHAINHATKCRDFILDRFPGQAQMTTWEKANNAWVDIIQENNDFYGTPEERHAHMVAWLMDKIAGKTHNENAVAAEEHDQTNA